MKFTLAWLRQHLATDAPLHQITDRLTMLGLEVESVDDPSTRLQGFVVGHLLEAQQHPNADRLKLCRVDWGKGVLQVVCGAPNARAGLKVILAVPGTVIPETGEPLKKGSIRGVESQGMMCSWRELGMGEDHSGIAELPLNAPVGSPVVEAMEFDPVIDISVTPNRADCLGVRGVARDLAAAGLGTLTTLPQAKVPGTFKSPINVTLDLVADRANACPLFAGRYIKGVKNGESPAWLKERLIAVGLRPISALVDITNYFTVDLSRPLHVFDAKKLTGHVRARMAKPGETIVTLGGDTYTLDSEMTVIADDAGAQGVAGVKGGEATSVSAATTDVFLEVALFDAQRTGRTGRALGVDSDARYRFERGVDPGFVIPAMELATRMIIELCGGEASEPVIAGAVPPDTRHLKLRPERVAKLGGIAVSPSECHRILEAIGCTVAEDGDAFAVTPPSWRADIVGEHDLVEEVVRVYGYDAIPAASMPRPPVVRPVLTATQRRTVWARRALAARGMVETVTFSFMASKLAPLFGGNGDNSELILANPIASDLDAMRPSILPNLIIAARKNADRGFRDLALFEVGPQYGSDRPEGQRLVAAGVRTGMMGSRHWEQKAREADAFDAKADALAAIAAAGGPAEQANVVAEAPSWYHPGRSGAIKLGTQVLAWFGELHPSVLAALDMKGVAAGFEVFIDALPPIKARPTKARPLLKASALQPVERDFAFILDAAVQAEAVARAARGADKALITDVTVFDLFAGAGVGEGKKSLAIQVTLQPVERTLTDAEIEAVGQKIVAAVAKATGGTLRS
ncbi:MAG TPA: phenylalanine--tRNA ligase subunit beta [Magnetospirillaceae bacterium]|jgi:phenylalanyl-tRNA synthetase beta chain